MTQSPTNSMSFMPTKTEWDFATAQLNAIRQLFSLPAGVDVVPSVRALLERASTQRALHMEQELAAIRNLFAHLAPDESSSVYHVCQHVLALHANQAQTIQAFLDLRNKDLEQELERSE